MFKVFKIHELTLQLQQTKRKRIYHDTYKLKELTQNKLQLNHELDTYGLEEQPWSASLP